MRSVEGYPNVANSLNNLAVLYFQADMRSRLCTRSIVLFRRKHSGSHPVSDSINNIAVLIMSRADMRSKALHKRE